MNKNENVLLDPNSEALWGPCPIFFAPFYKCIFSIKHYLARSCFQFWPKISNEGDKISPHQFFSRNFRITVWICNLEILQITNFSVLQISADVFYQIVACFWAKHIKNVPLAPLWLAKCCCYKIWISTDGTRILLIARAVQLDTFIC